MLLLNINCRWYIYIKNQKRIFKNRKELIILTHIKLSNKTAHIIMFVVKGQQFVPELGLILNDKTISRLKINSHFFKA